MQQAGARLGDPGNRYEKDTQSLTSLCPPAIDVAGTGRREYRFSRRDQEAQLKQRNLGKEDG